jgi:phosphate/sulfate permease
MTPVAIISEGVPVLHLSAKVWASLIAVPILSTAMANILYFKILVLTLERSAKFRWFAVEDQSFLNNLL